MRLVAIEMKIEIEIVIKIVIVQVQLQVQVIAILSRVCSAILQICCVRDQLNRAANCRSKASINQTLATAFDT